MKIGDPILFIMECTLDPLLPFSPGFIHMPNMSWSFWSVNEESSSSRKTLKGEIHLPSSQYTNQTYCTARYTELMTGLNQLEARKSRVSEWLWHLMSYSHCAIYANLTLTPGASWPSGVRAAITWPAVRTSSEEWGVIKWSELRAICQLTSTLDTRGGWSGG